MNPPPAACRLFRACLPLVAALWWAESTAAAVPAESVGRDLPVASKAPFVPTPWPVVEVMLELGRVGRSDFLIDLGSGDGRIVIEAARTRGARGFGVDIDPDLVKLSNGEARRLGVADRVEFFQRDLFETDLGRATVVTMYLLPKILLELRPRLLTELAAGTRIVSHDFGLGDWLPDATAKVPVPDRGFGPPFSTVYLWVVPAFVQGTWRGTLDEQGFELDLAQHFQRVTGTLRVAGRSARLESVTLTGDRLAFSAQPEIGGRRLRHDFTGTVGRGEITGAFVVAGRAAPIAARAQRASFAAPSAVR